MMVTEVRRMAESRHKHGGGVLKLNVLGLTEDRVAVHSVTGCVLYGAFVAKVLVVRSRRLSGWALPTAGGLLVAAIAVLWYTAALWHLDGRHLISF
jgi:hypothetical protein